MTRHETHNQQSFGSIDWLQEELAIEVRFIDDRDLSERIHDWLEKTNELPANDIIGIVDEHLSNVRQDPDGDGLAEFAMRRLDGDGRENFPDSCKGCDHYGTRCPVFVDPVEKRRRQMLEAEHNDSDMATTRRAARRYGESVGCHQITGAISQHFEQYQHLRKEGLQLYRESDVTIGHTDEADEVARAEAEAAQGGD